MITIGANGQKISYGIKHYNLDTATDLEKLNPVREQMGTTCFIIENSKYYMVNGQKEWIEVTPFGTTSSSNDNGNNPGEGTNPDDGENPGGGSNPDGSEDVNWDGGRID